MSKKLVILNPNHFMEVPFDQQLTIGRDIYNSLSLQDADISRSHAILFEQDAQTLIKDLNSRNGVYINGEKYKERALQDGDEIVLGKTIFFYNPPTGLDLEKKLSPRGRYLVQQRSAQKKEGVKEESHVFSAEQMDKSVQRLFNHPEGVTFFSLPNAMALLRAFYEMAGAPDTGELFKTTLKRTLGLLGGDRGVIMESDGAKKKLKVRSIVSQEDTATMIEIPREVLKVVLQEENCVFCPDIALDERFAGIVPKDNRPIHSFVAAPLVSGHNYYGLIYLDSATRAKEYDQIAMRSLFFIASLLAALLQPKAMHFLHEPMNTERIATPV